METIPQAIPNMVRHVRSLCDQRVRKTSPMISRRTMTIFAAQDWTLVRAESELRAGVPDGWYGIKRRFVQRNTNERGGKSYQARECGRSLRQSPYAARGNFVSRAG